MTEEELLEMLMLMQQEQEASQSYDFGFEAQDPMAAMLSSMLSSNMPQFTSSGKFDPFDLSQAAQRLNYSQDVGGSMFDVAQALFAGPDAWGNPQQFAPVVKYGGDAVPAAFDDEGNPVPVTLSARQLQDAVSGGGYQGLIADAIMRGERPENAVAMLREIIAKGPAATQLDPELQQQIAQVRSTLPGWRSIDPTTNQPMVLDRETAGWESFDEDDVMKTAQAFYEQKLEDDMTSAMLEYDPATGRFYSERTEEPSAAAQKFIDAGLPLPNEQWTDPQRVNAAWDAVSPSWRQDDYNREQDRVDSERALHDAMRSPERRALAAYQEEIDRRTTPAERSPYTGAVRRPSGGPMADGLVRTPQIVQDQRGNDRQVKPLNFRLPSFDFSMPIPEIETGPMVNRQAQRTYQDVLKKEQKARDQYSKDWGARNNTVSQGDRARFETLGQMIMRARQSTPLQETMAARLASLRNRTGM